MVSALSHAMESAGLRVTNEVTVTVTRPADIFISQWSDNGPDVTVTHPLDPSLGLSFSAARSALSVKEEAEVRKGAEIRHRDGERRTAFSPFALSTFGEFGRQADQIFSTLVDLYAAKHDLRRSIAAYQLRQQVLVALMRSMAKRLLLAVTASGGLSGGAPSAIDQQSS